MINLVELGWRWHEPIWCALLLLVAFAAVAHWRRRPATLFACAPLLARAAASEPAAARGSALPRTLRERLCGVPFCCDLIGATLFVLALARPQQLESASDTPPGRDLVLCLDRSSSMAATDLAPSRTRLEIGKELAAEFVRQRALDRVGCIEFARYADLVCPPTSDHDAVAELLQRIALVAKEAPEDATAIGGAVAAAAAVLQRSPAAGKVIVVVTDGEENVATTAAPREIAPLHAAQWCAQLGIRVHSIVVGRGNQNADGRFVALDTTAVRQLAKTTGGTFFDAGDAAALQRAYAAIDALEAVPFVEQRVVAREWFAWLIAAGLLFLALGHVLARTYWGGP